MTVVDTGYDMQIARRIHLTQPYIGNEIFMLTYDGISDIDINKLVTFHHSFRRLCTIIATKLESRFGFLEMNNNCVTSFREKSQNDVGYINSGFMLMKPGVFNYMKEDVMLEQELLINMITDGQVMAYKHDDFWHCMDTLIDKIKLEDMWNLGEVPWKIW